MPHNHRLPLFPYASASQILLSGNDDAMQMVHDYKKLHDMYVQLDREYRRVEQDLRIAEATVKLLQVSDDETVTGYKVEIYTSTHPAGYTIDKTFKTEEEAILAGETLTCAPTSQYEVYKI